MKKTFSISADHINSVMGKLYYDEGSFLKAEVDTREQTLRLNNCQPVFKAPAESGIGFVVAEDILYFNVKVKGYNYSFPVADIVACIPYSDVIRAAMSEHSRVTKEWNRNRKKKNAKHAK